MKTQSYRRVGTSKKRAKENAKYRRLKAKFLKNNPKCLVCGEWVALSLRQLHHWAGRTGVLLTWVPGFRTACPSCHTDIETHRKEASKLGYRAPERLFGRPSLVFKLYGE